MPIKSTRQTEETMGVTMALICSVATGACLLAYSILLWKKGVRTPGCTALMIFGAFFLVPAFVTIVGIVSMYRAALKYLNNCLDNLRRKKASIETGKADTSRNQVLTLGVLMYIITGAGLLLSSILIYCCSVYRDKFTQIFCLTMMIAGIFVTFMPLIIRAIGIVYQKIDNSLNNSNEKKASIGTDRVDVGRNEKRSSDRDPGRDQRPTDKESQNSTDKENISTDHINEKQLDSRGSKDTQNVSSHENERSQNSTDKEDTSTDQVNEELLSSETTEHTQTSYTIGMQISSVVSAIYGKITSCIAS